MCKHTYARNKGFFGTLELLEQKEAERIWIFMIG